MYEGTSSLTQSHLKEFPEIEELKKRFPGLSEDWLDKIVIVRNIMMEFDISKISKTDFIEEHNLQKECIKNEKINFDVWNEIKNEINDNLIDFFNNYKNAFSKTNEFNSKLSIPSNFEDFLSFVFSVNPFRNKNAYSFINIIPDKEMILLFPKKDLEKNIDSKINSLYHVLPSNKEIFHFFFFIDQFIKIHKTLKLFFDLSSNFFINTSYSAFEKLPDEIFEENIKDNKATQIIKFKSFIIQLHMMIYFIKLNKAIIQLINSALPVYFKDKETSFFWKKINSFFSKIPDITSSNTELVNNPAKDMITYSLEHFIKGSKSLTNVEEVYKWIKEFISEKVVIKELDTSHLNQFLDLLNKSITSFEKTITSESSEFPLLQCLSLKLSADEFKDFISVIVNLVQLYKNIKDDKEMYFALNTMKNFLKDLNENLNFNKPPVDFKEKQKTLIHAYNSLFSDTDKK